MLNKKSQKFKQTEIGKIPEDWEIKQLIEISDNITDGSHFSPKEDLNGKRIIATVKDMRRGGFDFSNCKKITEEDFITLKKNGCSPIKGDILISKDGAKCLNIIFVYDTNKEIVLLSSIAIIRLSKDYDPYFYQYYLLSTNAQKIMKDGFVSGSAIPRVILNNFKRVPIPLPSLSEQKAIAKILSSLDAKIELNNKMNKTLEAIGQAIFRKWFVEGKKEGWKVSTIGRELKTILGGTPSRVKPEYWNGDINWINSGKVNEFRITESSEKITEEGLKKSATSLLPKRTIVLAITGATLGQVSKLEIDTCANQSVIGILENEKFSSEYIYFWIKNKIYDIIGFQTGGAQQHINKTNIDDYDLLVPNGETLDKFNKLVKPIFKQISINCFQNQTLSQIRDALLPKLMSGEVRVR